MSLDDRLSSLTPAQRELFEVLRKKREEARPARREPPPLVRRPTSAPDTAWPLALDQERLWFLHQLGPTDISFNIGEVNLLEGPLDPGVLAGCLTGIVRRHESWRTTFPERDGHPVQVVSPVSPEWTVPLPLIDLGGLPEARRETEARRVSLAELRLRSISPGDR